MSNFMTDDRERICDVIRENWDKQSFLIHKISILFQDDTFFDSEESFKTFINDFEEKYAKLIINLAECKSLTSQFFKKIINERRNK